VESLELRRLLSAVPLDGTVPAGNATPFGYSPLQIEQAYGINSIHFGSVVGNGAGQTIAVIAAFDNPDLVDSTDPNFDTSDLHLFDQYFGLPDPPSFLKVDQDGGTNYPLADSSWANESAMDVEWAHALAPAANILLVEANNSSLGNLISAGVNYARSVAGVSVISMSFGATEASSETIYDSTLTTPAGHTGITFVAGTGDNGAPGEYPATSPNVLAVGATTLTLGSTGGYGSETAYSGSGGGPSVYESKPVYQDALTPAGPTRTTPDVAFNGNPNTGVDVYDLFNGGSADPWYKVGGTSAAAPAWSALIAITDQGRALRGAGSLNGPTQTLPMIYELNSSDFHDITTGSNGYSAGPGYDLVTGRGTPIANMLVPDLAGYTSISGTVFNDANDDGVQDNGELGIAGVTVYIDSNNNGILDSGEISTVTNSSGNYTLTGLTAGTYVVRQILPSGQEQTFPTKGFGNHVTVAAGQAATNVDFGDESSTVVTPPPPTGGSISGTVFNDANGDGVQDDGEPSIAGVTVYDDATNAGVFKTGDLEATTNAAGVYTFTGLSAGAYLIRQILPSGDKQTFPTLGFGNHVTLTANQSTTNINFGDESSTVVTPPPPPSGGSITGTVFNDANGNGKQDSGELGIANVSVYIDATNAGVFKTGDLETTTNASGIYTFTGLSASTYLVRQILPSGDKQTLPTNGFGNHVTLTTGQAATNANFGDQGAAAVVPASITGTVINVADSNGIGDVVMYIDLNNAGVFQAGDPEAITSGSGVYTFTNLAAGTYIVRQMIPSGDIQISPANNFGNHVTVAAGQDSTGNNFGDNG
jgi:hypothetical protein